MFSERKFAGNSRNISYAFCFDDPHAPLSAIVVDGHSGTRSWEPWMRTADRLLDDDELVERLFEAQAPRFLKSRTRGRRQTPAEVVLRLLILKHVRDWSYEVLEREVRANLVYRTFARIGAEKVPDTKTLGRLGQVVGPEVITIWIGAWSRSQWNRRSWPESACGWIPPWSRRISTIRPTAVCWAMECAY